MKKELTPEELEAKRAKQREYSRKARARKKKLNNLDYGRKLRWAHKRDIQASKPRPKYTKRQLKQMTYGQDKEHARRRMKSLGKEREYDGVLVIPLPNGKTKEVKFRQDKHATKSVRAYLEHTKKMRAIHAAWRALPEAEKQRIREERKRLAREAVEKRRKEFKEWWEARQKARDAS